MTVDEVLRQVDGSFSDLMEEQLRALGSQLLLEDRDVDAITAVLLAVRARFETERPHTIARARAAIERLVTPDGRLREDVDPSTTPQ